MENYELEILLNSLSRALDAYSNYLNNKSFKNAKVIKTHNLKSLDLIKKLIKSNSFKKLEADLIKIKVHLETWYIDWNNLQECNKPAENDIFIFETRVPFPKESEFNIKKYIGKS